MQPIATGVAACGLGSSTGRVLLLCAVLLGTGIAGSVGLLVSYLHERALATTGRNLERIALVLATQAERTLQAVELVQASMLEQLKGTEASEQLRQVMDGIDVHQGLQDRIRGLPQISALSVVDADGELLNSSYSWPSPSLNVRDLEPFRVLQADLLRMTFLSGPIRSRMTGKWTVFIARKITAPDGGFLGLILAALDLEYFENLYGAAGFGPDSFISLFRQDGVLLARHPRIEFGIGQAFAVEAHYRQLLAEGLRSDLRRRVSSVDGIDKLIAMQILPGYPLVINVAMTVERALADWRKQAAYLLAAAILLELLMIGTSLLVMRHLRSQRLLADANTARANAEAELRLAWERERAQDQARIQDDRFGAALQNMSQGLCMFSPEHRLMVMNARCRAIFRIRDADEVIGLHFNELIDLAVLRGAMSVAAAADLKARTMALVASGDRVSYLRDLGDGRSLAICLSPMASRGWLVTYEDITERRQAEAQIVHMAHHDALTGLPNRVLFRKRLEEVLVRSRRDESFAVLFLDLDHFKVVNDSLGHPMGDALLRAVTERLLLHVRETDSVARLGGDEFAIIQAGVDQPRDATVLSRRLIETLSEPYDVDGQTVAISTTIGIAMVPGDGTDADTILKNAELALYRAKADGRSTFRFFEPQMDARMQARRLLELDLRHALVAGEFELFYQPIMDLHSRRVSAFEALIRWRHPERGLVTPDTFIPLAEEIGLILPIGEWVLRRACADAVSWPAPLKVAVNLSTVQFSGCGPVAIVEAALAASGLDPARLEIEITETVMLDDTDATLQVLRDLKALGVSVAMDDFGTGYSSLSYLRKFPFDRVKIDKSFISDLNQSDESVAIVLAVTNLCKTLGMATTAEGVETEAQLQGLQIGCCTNVQGYLFSEPRPAGEVAELCRMLGTAVESAPPRAIAVATG